MSSFQTIKDMLLIIVLLALILTNFSSQNLVNGEDNIADVTDYGAEGDGKTDDSEAFQKAWKVVCHGRDSGNGSCNLSFVLLIPRGGKFLLSPTTFEGPCNCHSTVTVRVQGDVIASRNRSDHEQQCERWIIFKSINNLVIEGSGSFDGQGKLWWRNKKPGEEEEPDKKDKTKSGDEDKKKPDKPREDPKHSNGKQLPTNLAFFDCKHLRVYNISSKNSAKNHVSISQCMDVVFSNVTIKAPEDSQNTDGIDISHSSEITIKDSHIGTGDDCIEINTGTSNVNISNVNCGPGHGISIGSFKRKEANVENVHVRDCNFNGSTNGARIKNYPDGLGGYVKSITFQNITLNKVKNPIIINQFYDVNLVTRDGKADEGDGVKISDVKFIGFKGTCSGEDAIVLKCGDGSGCCTGISLRDVKIKGSRGQSVRAVCHNAHGSAESTSPEVNCLKDDDDDHDGSI